MNIELNPVDINGNALSVGDLVHPDCEPDNVFTIISICAIIDNTYHYLISSDEAKTMSLNITYEISNVNEEDYLTSEVVKAN